MLAHLQAQIEANKEALEQGIMKIMESEDIFTKAVIDKSIENMDQVLMQGIPDEARQMLGLMGFRVVVSTCFFRLVESTMGRKALVLRPHPH